MHDTIAAWADAVTTDVEMGGHASPATLPQPAGSSRPFTTADWVTSDGRSIRAAAIAAACEEGLYSRMGRLRHRLLGR